MNDQELDFYGEHEPGLYAAFYRFHKAHPDVYDRLVRLARLYRRRHGPEARLGVATLWETLRWKYYMTTSGRKYKLNNNHRAYYSRAIMESESDLKGIFETRKTH